MMRIISPLFAALLLLTVSFVQAEELKFPGKESAWNGFKKFDFEVDGKQVLVVTPKKKQLEDPGFGMANSLATNQHLISHS